MAVRKPLVLVGGSVSELPAADTVSGGGIRFTYASSAPSSPLPGDRWLDSTVSVLYTYVDDGTSSQWVEL